MPWSEAALYGPATEGSSGHPALTEQLQPPCLGFPKSMLLGVWEQTGVCPFALAVYLSSLGTLGAPKLK